MRVFLLLVVGLLGAAVGATAADFQIQQTPGVIPVGITSPPPPPPPDGTPIVPSRGRKRVTFAVEVTHWNAPNIPASDHVLVTGFQKDDRGNEQRIGEIELGGIYEYAGRYYTLPHTFETDNPRDVRVRAFGLNRQNQGTERSRYLKPQ